MPVFPSEAWCGAIVQAVNADPAARTAGEGWAGDVACVVEAERGVPAFAFWCRPEAGRIAHWRVLDDLDEVDELAPAYVIRGGYLAWKQLLCGSLDPVQAILERRIRFVGDVEQVIARARHQGLASRALAAVATRFADDPEVR